LGGIIRIAFIFSTCTSLEKKKKCDNCGEAVEKILLLRGKRKEVD